MAAQGATQQVVDRHPKIDGSAAADYELHVTSRSKSIITELKNYTWAKNKDGRYTNIPIDAYNHALDALRYYVLGKLLGRIMRTVHITADDLPF